MTILGIGIDGDLPVGLVGLMAVAICLYIISFKDSDMAMPYKLPGLFGTSLVMFIFASVYLDSVDAKKLNIIYISVCVAAVLAVALCTKLKGLDKASLAYVGIVALSFIISIITLYIMPDTPDRYKEDIFVTVLKIPAFAGFITMIISGAREKKLLPINLGFVGVSALAMVLVYQSGLSMLGNGLMLLVFGAVLLVINFKISKAKQKTPALENNGEVHNDEK
jgi:hypothetical protein